MSVALENPQQTHATGASARPGGLRVALLLAIGEGRRAFRHPAILSAVGLTIFLTIRAALAFIQDSPDPGDAGWIGMFGLLPLVVLLFIFDDLLGSRDRRHGVEDLFESLPAPARVRTLAVLASVTWSVLAAAIAATPFTIYVFARGVPGGPSDLGFLGAQLLFLVVLAGTVAVALGRWIPSPVAGLVAAVGFGFLLVAGVSGASFRAFFALLLGTDVRAALAWHLVYLAGLAVLAGSLAMLRDGVRRGPLLAAGFGLALAVVAGILQLPDICPGTGPCVWR